MMKIKTTNGKINFKDYFYLSEALEFGEDEKGRGYFGVKAPEGSDVFSLKTLIEVLKDIKNDKKRLWEFIKKRAHHFSPLLVVLSMMIMGINTQLFINQNPEVLKTNPKIVETAANILNKNPKLLKLFQK